MAVRRFVLAPASQVAAEMVHPETGWTIAELLHRLSQPPHYVAIAGVRRCADANLAVTAAAVVGMHVLLDPGIAASGSGRRGSGAVSVAARASCRRSSRSAARGCGRRPARRRHLVYQQLLVAGVPGCSTGPVVGRCPAQVEQACELAMRQVPSPHCVLFLDAPAARSTGRQFAAVRSLESATVSDDQRRAGGSWRTNCPCRGNVPCSSAGGDSRLALTELAAAIDAMR